ncbi:MAG: TPM domain-containing protein [Thermoanaerobaculia bacterium]|nr:TPM domain-containing protein [Thermoanaerobaculia bacterium]
MRGESRRVFTPLLLALAFFLALTLPARALEIPPAPKQWFTDTAGFVSQAEAIGLNSKLQTFEQQSGAQFLIYTFPSLDGASIEDFTIRAVERWKVGQKKYDNGLVIFVFRAERKVRIETGYGLEGTITDAFSSRVIREVMAPRFQTGDWGGGFNAGADAIIARITKGEAPVEPLNRPGGQPQSVALPPYAVILILLFVFFVLVPMLTGRGRRGRGGCGGCFWPMLFLPGGGSGITFGGGGFSGGGGFGGGGGFSGGGGGFGGGGATGGW